MANEHLQRSPTNYGNRSTYTWSGWIKRNQLGAWERLFSTAGQTMIQLTGSSPPDQIRYFHQISGNFDLRSAHLLRDVGSWMHLVVSVDHTHQHSKNRVRMFLNGAEIDNYGTDSTSNGTQNLETYFNSMTEHALLGREDASAGENFQGEVFDIFWVDGQALTPDVFGFYKDGDGYQSSGTDQATDFRSGQWSPRLPKSIKHTINRGGGFGVNGFYLPLNDSSNFGADFHCTPNSIIKLKGEDEPQPRNGAPTTSDAFVSQLREEKGSEDLPFEGVVKFGGFGTNSSLKFPDHSDLELGASPFTAECWVYPQDTSQSNFGGLFNKGYGFQVYWKDDIEALQLFVSSDGSNYDMINGVTSLNGSVPKGKWTHIAVVRESGNNTWKIYTNGKLTYGPLVVSGTAHNNGNPWGIGDYVPSPGTYEFMGFISDFRLVVGSAVYTAPFTPPTTRLTNITNTKLLCCQSATNVTEAAVAPTTATTAGGENTFATKNEMTGSIVLAVPFISHPTGSNLLGSFGALDSSTGWALLDPAAPTISGGKAIWDGTSGAGLLQRAESPAVITTGNYYIIKFTMTRTAGTLKLRAGNGEYSSTFTESGNHTVVVKAGSSTTETILFYGNSFNGTVDDVEIYQQDTIRDYSADIRGSGTNKTVTVNGTFSVGDCPSHYGSALLCNPGTSGYAEVAANAEFAYLWDVNHTIEFWYKNDSWNGSYLPHASIIGLRHSNSNVAWRIAFTDKNSVNEDGIQLFGTNGFNTGAQILNNDWNHCAVEQYNDKVTIYVNGCVAGQNNGPVGYESNRSSNGPIIMGTDPRSPSLGDTYSYDGQIQDVRIYKGIAKYKGGFDVPKPYTPQSIVTHRATVDTCKSNFPTWNNLQSSMTLTDGSLTCTGSSSSQESYSTVGITTGKWYVEARTNNGTFNHFGLRASSLAEYGSTYRLIARDDGNVYGDASQGQIGTLSDNYNQVGDIVAMAIDGDNGQVTFYINGVNVGGPYSIYQYSSAPTPYKIYNLVNSGNSLTLNFGQNPTFSGNATAGTNTDGNGKGLFKYAPPTGFLALCDDNLPTPAVADPGKHFKTVLWKGNGATGHAISKVGFKPDLVWIFNRDRATYKPVFDSIRGAENMLRSNMTNAQGTFDTVLQSFDSDGFTVGGDGAHNYSGERVSAWCWKAGGMPVVNTDGSASSLVSANQEAGFSIVKFTAQTSGSITLGHGLGKKPAFWIWKDISGTTGWYVYHQRMGASAWLQFDAALATTGNSAAWGGVEPTTTVFTHGWGFANQNDVIMYVWAEIEGYSKFGSYIGNNNDNGKFILN